MPKIAPKKTKEPPQAIQTKKGSRFWLRWLFGLIALLILVLGAELAILTFQRTYAQSVYPGVRIGTKPFGGQRYLDALLTVESYIKDIEARSIEFKAGDKTITITPAALATDDPDLAYSLITFDADQTVDRAYAIGRSGSTWQRLSEQLRSRLFGLASPFVFEIDQTRLAASLTESVQSLETAAVEAKYEIDSAGQLTVVAEKNGERFDLDTGLAQLESSLNSFVAPIQIGLNRVPVAASVSAGDLTAIKDQAQAVLDRAPYQLKFTDGQREITKNELAGWLTIRKGQGAPQLGLNDQARLYLTELAATIDQPAQNGRFEIKDGVVTEKSAGISGQLVDVEKTSAALATAWLGATPVEANVVMASQPPDVTGVDTSRLGQLEILGTGHSNFAGSPKNRRHNIATGAAALHGLLIKPGEEFSLANALGPIEASTGYLPELVIKGDKTIPEYGGGLCQIGTTTFRAAMAAGLPITERRAHSYNVSYYLENGKPGTDATIYPPHPDLRFTNDTGRYILIQTRIEGSDIYFDFWGTKDGRTAERTTPRVWDWVDPPPTKEIVSTELSPGERKCTERAHRGVKAEFSYTIKYADSTVKEQTFRSVYKPWQEVCLVGA